MRRGRDLLRANQTLRWVDIAQAEKMCDGRKPFWVFDQKQSNNYSQSEEQGSIQPWLRRTYLSRSYCRWAFSPLLQLGDKRQGVCRQRLLLLECEDGRCGSQKPA